MQNMNIDSNDYIQDICFDYYGERMAVCSTDRKILIYNKSDVDSQWIKTSEFEAHDAPIFRVQWAHPEFGIILASCGFDKRVNIWQEKREDGNIIWTSRAKIQDFSDSVEDISFCPKIHGLKLAATTLNGKMKIFEPTDYLNNINWNCISQKDVSSVGCSSICWNQNIYDPQTLIVGCYYDKDKKNNQELIQIFGYSDNKKEYVLLEKLVGHSDSITDVQWASQFGRSYHMIASSSRDGKVIIWKVHLDYDYNNEHFDNITIKSSIMYTYDHFATNKSSRNEIVRLSWNLSGTLLAAIDEKGNKILIKKEEDEKFSVKNLNQ